MFTVIINQPGYLPEVEPVDFDTCAKAWRYLESELSRDWESWEEVRPDSEDHDYLEAHTAIHSHDTNTPGVVYAGGFAYCVEVAE